MTPTLFKKKLYDHGFDFIKSASSNCFTRSINGIQQHVSRDSVRGGAWRLFLAVGNVPEGWPVIDVHAVQTWVAAESPWFNYLTDLDPTNPLDTQCDNREVALEKCFQWLITIGFEWLNNPGAKSEDDWRKANNILVRMPTKAG